MGLASDLSSNMLLVCIWYAFIFLTEQNRYLETLAVGWFFRSLLFSKRVPKRGEWSAQRMSWRQAKSRVSEYFMNRRVDPRDLRL